jgi:DNA-binding CsgD family transcriptional regulator
VATAVTDQAAPLGAAQVAGSSRALLVVDDDCNCIEASLGACSLLGAARDDLVGRNVGDLLEPSSREAFSHVWEAFSVIGGHAGPFTLEAPRSVVEVEIAVTPAVLPGSHLLSLEAHRGKRRPEKAPGAHEQPVFRDPGHGRMPTSRERQVLALLASGSTDTEAAELLALSPATVQTHVRNAKAKLGARTRAQAVALALHRGLIEDV